MATSKANKCLLCMVGILALTCIILAILYFQTFEEVENFDYTDDDSVHPLPEPETEPENEESLTHEWQKNVRLPRNVYPNHYDLYLYPNLETGLFIGKVDIHVNSSSNRNYFYFHIKDLTIDRAKMFKGQYKSNANEVDVMERFEYPKNEYYVLRTAADVPPDNYIIALEFSGNLTGSLVGFYKSVYTNNQGKSIPIATSKFQPTYARRAFPCFDEPSFKSTFSTTLVRPSEGYIALSNMPVQKEISRSPTKAHTEVVFKKSVPMVTYLACFIVCDFEYEEELTKIHGTRFRVYATPTQKERVRYSLNIGSNITDYFEDYFKVPYPLPKQDMIAIPDFISGAMEHWGLITYRETNLLYDSRESSSYNQQRVASVVSHELAHQWFGNLVTLSWWDDLWLNEGFASYIEYKGVDNYHKDWDMESQFLILDLHRVMDLDATINSHPIVQEVSHPDQITEIFDVISYSKGASVLRMCEDFMGAEEFQQGISNFLKKYSYANAVTNDLWDELSEVSSKNLDITKIMDTWTRQMGLPLITVEKISPNRYKIKQERYMLDAKGSRKSGEADKSPFNYKWEIPITWITDQNSEKQQKWFNSDEGFLEIDIPSGVKWTKFNVGQYGYYRVQYPIDEWLQFSEILRSNHNSIAAIDRASLINDVFSLAESKHLEYSVPLSMVHYLQHEDSYVPWEASVKKLSKIEGLLVDSSAFPQFRKFMLQLIEKQYNNLGWSDVGSHTEKLNRVNILKIACRNGHEGCLKEAGTLFEEWIKNGNYLSPNIRSIVYRYGMQSKGDINTWNIMLQRFQNEKNAQEKKKLLYGLAFADKPWILKQFLRIAKNETIIRSQDYFTALRYMSANPVGTSIVWEYFRADYQYLVDRFTLNDRYFGRMPKYLTSFFSTQFQLDELKNFFHANPDAGAGKRARKQALENVENNIKWLSDHESAIQIWLDQNVPTA